MSSGREEEGEGVMSEQKLQESQTRETIEKLIDGMERGNLTTREIR